MAKNEKSSSYQSLGNGVYRVGGAVSRNAVTGRYITGKSAARHQGNGASERPSGTSKSSSPRA